MIIGAILPVFLCQFEFCIMTQILCFCNNFRIRIRIPHGFFLFTLDFCFVIGSPQRQPVKRRSPVLNVVYLTPTCYIHSLWSLNGAANCNTRNCRREVHSFLLHRLRLYSPQKLRHLQFVPSALFWYQIFIIIIYYRYHYPGLFVFFVQTCS